MPLKEDEYYCSGTESAGFKTLLPMAMPELLEFGFGVHPGMETFVDVIPEMVHALDTVSKFDYHTRQCYLNSDTELHFFKNYTFLNCFQECVANYTKQACSGCLATNIADFERIVARFCSNVRCTCTRVTQLYSERLQNVARI